MTVSASLLIGNATTLKALRISLLCAPIVSVALFGTHKMFNFSSEISMVQPWLLDTTTCCPLFVEWKSPWKTPLDS